MNPSLKSRLAGKNLAQLEATIEQDKEGLTIAAYDGDCDLEPLPALVLDCPCEVAAVIPPIAGSSDIRAYTQN